MNKMTTENGTGYGTIFKTTFLFGFVQIFNIVVKVGINKIVAVLLGPEGMGIIGLFNTAINTIKTGAGLGVSQSAVRDISEANASNNYESFSRTISITNRVIIFTSLFGVILTIVLSPLLSKWQFGNSSYTIAFLWLSIVVGLNILSDGQLAILKGMRQLKALAKASMLGSVVGLISAIPFYYFFKEGGIIPSLAVTAFAALFFSNLYVKRIDYKKSRIPFKQFIGESSPMIKMGIALMFVGFIGSLFDMVVASLINNLGNLVDVGLYNAGATIITGYFGVVITAMSTDYYPRISAVHRDNGKLAVEMNRQSETGLVMILPLAVLFVFLSPLFIYFLYTETFLDAKDYTDYAMIGTVIIIVSNCMGMILLAKQASSIFIVSVISQKFLLLVIYYFLYQNMGLIGLGISYLMSGVIHLLTMIFILSHFYDIRLAKRIWLLLLLVILCIVITIFVRGLNNALIKYICGVIILLGSSVFSFFYMKQYMGIDIIIKIKSRIKHD